MPCDASFSQNPKSELASCEARSAASTTASTPRTTPATGTAADDAADAIALAVPFRTAAALAVSSAAPLAAAVSRALSHVRRDCIRRLALSTLEAPAALAGWPAAVFAVAALWVSPAPSAVPALFLRHALRAAPAVRCAGSSTASSPRSPSSSSSPAASAVALKREDAAWSAVAPLAPADSASPWGPAVEPPFARVPHSGFPRRSPPGSDLSAAHSPVRTIPPVTASVRRVVAASDALPADLAMPLSAPALTGRLPPGRRSRTSTCAPA